MPARGPLSHIAEQLEAQRSSGLRDVTKFVFWLKDIRNRLDPVLLPALAKAKQRAWTTACQNNLHQLGLGMKMYGEDDSKTCYPLAGGGISWPNSSWMEQLYPYVPTTNVMHCPTDRLSIFSYFYGIRAAYVASQSMAVTSKLVQYPTAYVLAGDTTTASASSGQLFPSLGFRPG